MEPATRIPLEMLYGALVPTVALMAHVDRQLYAQGRSLLVELARVLGKPCPIQARAARRSDRRSLASD